MQRKVKAIILACVIIIGGVLIFNRHTIVEKIVELIAEELDRERELDVGTYTVVDWQDGKFRIMHKADGNRLEFIKDSDTVVLLEDIDDYNITNNRLYIYAQDGAAVISEDSVAYICYFEISQEDEEYTVNNDGQSVIFSKSYEEDSINYLSDFEDFQESDRIILEKLTD